MLSEIFDYNPDAIVVVDGQGLIIKVNARTQVLFGYSQQELQNQPMEVLLPERFRQQHTRHRNSFFTSPQMREMGAGLVLFARRKNGSEFPVDVLISTIHVDNDILGLAIVRDITERKRLEQAREESEARFRAVAETASDAMISCNSDDHIVYANAAAEEMFGCRADSLLGTRIDQLIPGQLFSQDDRPLGASHQREAVGQRINGSDFPLELTVATWTLGGERYYTAIIRDITQRKQQEHRLNDALREKEMLLKEVYHRVKNNLQVIQSLLSMEARTLPEGAARAAMNETGARVRAMALVHEKLYQSGNLASISLKAYIRDLVQQMENSSAADNRSIAVQTDVPDVDVGLDTAIPLGLLLNELVSNSIKHAFPDHRPGTIRIAIEPWRFGSLLTVSDDGIGLPDDFNLGDCKSMGLTLATRLARQLDGRLAIESQAGTRVSLELRAPLGH